MSWFQKFMYGRYGADQLSNFMFVMYVLLVVLQMLFRSTPAGPILMVVSYVLVFLYFFRVLSRNIYRRQMENQKFLKLWNPVKGFFRFLKLRFQERKGVNKVFRCPKCHQVVRVPRGKGKIAIRCPKCRFEFIKKT